MTCPDCRNEAIYKVFLSFSYLYCTHCKKEVGGVNPEQEHLFYRNWYYNGYDKRWLYPYSANGVKYRTDEALSIQKYMDKGFSFDEACKKNTG